jgi:hypothetical protein
MIGLFSRIRRNLFMNNNTRRYLLYSLGEVVLIVFGILIANWLSQSADRDKLKIQEIRILNGLKQSLAQDTLTLGTNIRKYQNMSTNDSILFYHLLYKKELTQNIVSNINYASTYNSFLILRLSYFEEAKQKGLDIISNFELRDKIKRVYENDYQTLLRIENEGIAYDYEGIMNPKFQNYIGVKPSKSNGTEVFVLDYNKLLNDTQFHQEMFKYWQIKNNLRLQNYLPIRIKVIKLIHDLDKELELLYDD